MWCDTYFEFGLNDFFFLTDQKEIRWTLIIIENGMIFNFRENFWVDKELVISIEIGFQRLDLPRYDHINHTE